ncbi:MAG: zinc ribbon domain-containing protein [Lachnospiraceae bacterium]
MAMIQCPECGQEISDKAKKCIHCGKVFVEEKPINEEIKCSECGAVLAETDEICPNCGCPVEKIVKQEDTKPQQVEVASIKMAAKTKKIIIGIIIAIIICVGGGIGYKIYSDNKAEQLYRESYNEYIDNLGQVKILMLSGGSDAESLCNLTLRVWGNAIYEDKDDETDKYTRPNGYFVKDFNEALVNLYVDSETKDNIEGIEGNQVSVKELIKKLQNPPEDLDKCYDTVSDLYEAYKTLTDLAINPSGNYSGFSTKKSDAVSDFMSAYEKLDNQIPEKLKDK